EPELVQRSRAQLGDETAQRLDVPRELLDRVAEARPDLLTAVQPCRARQQDLQSPERLQRLVVQLAVPSPTLSLGGLERAPQPIRRNRLGVPARGRRLIGERLEQRLVVGGEARVAAETVERHE